MAAPDEDDLLAVRSRAELRGEPRDVERERLRGELHLAALGGEQLREASQVFALFLALYAVAGVLSVMGTLKARQQKMPDARAKPAAPEPI